MVRPKQTRKVQQNTNGGAIMTVITVADSSSGTISANVHNRTSLFGI